MTSSDPADGPEVRDLAADSPAAESAAPDPRGEPRPDRPAVKRSTRRQASPLRNALEWILVIVGAVLIALLIRGLVVQSFRIPSESMYPTLTEGDRVLVNRLSYRLHDVNRGDVVVFRRPESSPAPPGEPEDLIKRVIGLPGETVVAREGTVYVNDRPLEEPYLEQGMLTKDLDQPVKVPEGEVFVMGDNRTNSSDSRYIGTIPIDSVVGRAFAVIWPVSRWSGL